MKKSITETLENMENFKFPPTHIFVEKDENGYYAYSTGFEGCQTRGSSPEEVTGATMRKVKEVLELLIYIRTVGLSKRTGAIELLIDALIYNENSCVRKEAASSLYKITGLDFGEDSSKWQEWWKKNKH